MPFAEFYAHVTEVCGDKERAQKDILQTLERGDLKAHATQERNLNHSHISKHHLITGSNWEIAQIPWEGGCDPILFRRPHWPPDMGIEAKGVYVSREDVLRLWKPPTILSKVEMMIADRLEQTTSNTSDNLPPIPAEAVPPAPGSRMKDPRGRKGDWRWEEILIEAARYMYARQNPGSQADLFSHLREWLNDPDGGPSDTAMKTHVGPLWQAFKKTDDV
jgi:hypothetical protein